MGHGARSRTSPSRTSTWRRRPLKDIPLKDIAAAGAPLKDIPLKDIAWATAPLKDIPLKDIDLAASGLAGVPLTRDRLDERAARRRRLASTFNTAGAPFASAPAAGRHARPGRGRLGVHRRCDPRPARRRRPRGSARPRARRRPPRPRGRRRPGRHDRRAARRPVRRPRPGPSRISPASSTARRSGTFGLDLLADTGVTVGSCSALLLPGGRRPDARRPAPRSRGEPGRDDRQPAARDPAPGRWRPDRRRPPPGPRDGRRRARARGDLRLHARPGHVRAATCSARSAPGPTPTAPTSRLGDLGL